MIIKKSRPLFFLLAVLLLTSSPILHISPVSAIGAYTSTSSTIDGAIGAAEWQDAETKAIDLGGGYTGTLYVMNDLANLYIALEITDPTPGNDWVFLIFDDDGDGVADDGAAYDQTAATYTDFKGLGADSQQDGAMSSTSGGGKNYFEFSKLFETADLDDWSFTAGYITVTTLKFLILYVDPGVSVNLYPTSGWDEINLKSPWRITIENVRHPDQVKVGQKTFVTVDVKCERLLPENLPLKMDIWDSSAQLDSVDQLVSDNRTVTHTFELTAPAAPTTWDLDLHAFPAHCYYLGDKESISIDVKADLGIAPDVEGICIWKGPPPPESAPPSQQIEIPIEVKYAVTYDAWINVGVYDEGGVLVSTVKFDEKVSGAGTNNYIFKVTTPATEGPWNLKASLYYGHVVGVDSVHKDCDEWPFTLTVTLGVPGGEGVKIIDVNAPAEVNSGGEVKVDIQTEYELPAGAKYRVNILDATSGAVIKTSGEESTASHGFKTFTLDKVYAPIVLTNATFKLLTTAEYRTDGDWKILDPEGKKEFEIKVIAAAAPPGAPPSGPSIPPLPLPPGVSPPAPADFDFTLTVTPTTQEATPGKPVRYQVTVSGVGNQTQLVTLGLSGYPLGATVNLQPLAGTPTYTSNVNVTLGGSVQPGTYSLNINATGGGKTHTQTVSLVVKSPPDFSISLSKQEVRVIRGQSTSLDVAVQPLHGFNTPINLNVKKAPSGVTVNLNPTSGTPSFTSKTDIKVDSNAVPGTYTLTISAKGSGEKTAQVILSVEAERQAPPGTQPQFPYGLLTLIIILILLAALVITKRRRRPKPAAPPARFCIECGAEVPPDAIHCPKCGAKQQ